MARRTAIKDIKFQDMFQLFIKDYKKLKLYEENIYEIDLLFDIEKIKKNRLVFKFSIISGIIIVNSLKNTEQESKLKIKSVACDVNIQRCL